MIALLIAAVTWAAPLTLDQALERAEEASLELRIQDLVTEAAGANWLADPRAGDPSLRVGVRDLGDPGGSAPDLLTRLRFPLPRPWERGNARREGETSQAREQAELERLRAELRLAVTTRFHALPILREAAELATAQSEARDRHLALVQARREEGLSSALDWLESEEDRRDAQTDQASVARQLAETEAELKVLCGLPPSEPLELVEAADGPVGETAGAEALLDGLLERSPRIAEARARVVREQTRLQRAQQQSIPWLDWVEGGVRKRDGDPLVYEAQVAFNIPVYKWSGRRLGPQRTQLAEAELRLEGQQLQAAEDVVRRIQDVEGARERHRLAREHREALESEGLPMLELADPLLKTELEARIALARMRESLAWAELVLQVDQLEAAAALGPSSED